MHFWDFSKISQKYEKDRYWVSKNSIFSLRSFHSFESYSNPSSALSRNIESRLEKKETKRSAVEKRFKKISLQNFRYQFPFEKKLKIISRFLYRRYLRFNIVLNARIRIFLISRFRKRRRRNVGTQNFHTRMTILKKQFIYRR